MKTKAPILQYRFAEIRAQEDGAGFSGHASHFGSVDSYGTVIVKGAYKKTIKERGDRIPLLWQHDPYFPIGRISELKEDSIGLYFNAEVVEDTEKGAEAMALLRAGVPLGMSVGFETVKSRAIEESDDFDFSNAPNFYKSKEGREWVRVYEEIRLWELSPVTFAANRNAEIDDVRSEQDLDALTSTLERLRSGSLDQRSEALIAELVAAWGDRSKPEPGESTPLADQRARRRHREAEAALALARHGITLGANP